MKNTKPWYFSKTLWTNFGIGMLPLIIENFILLKEFLPSSIYGIILFATVVINGILRFVTTQGLTSK